MDPVRKRFSPEDLQGELSKSGIDGTVLVQTLLSLDESRELLETASHWEWVRGVVGWVAEADMLHTVLADRRIVTGRKAQDKVVRMRGLGGGNGQVTTCMTSRALVL